MKIFEIPTPALVLDKTDFEYNLSLMAELAKDNGLDLRPHYKSHKCPEIAKKQIELGAVGVCCAKLGEAFDLADSGIQDIYIANQITDHAKIEKLAKLAGRVKLSLCVDSKENLADIEKALEKELTFANLYIELDTGMGRCGVDEEGVLALAKYAREKCPRLNFVGIQAYSGHISHEYDNKKRKSAVKLTMDKLTRLIGMLKSEGFENLKISGVSTGTLLDKAPYGIYSEIQVGSYIFFDTSYGMMTLPFKNSLKILATVISVKPDRAITDAGVKSCGVDQEMPKVSGLEGAELALHEEHGIISLANHGLKVNDRVAYIPGHCCSTVNLYRKIYLCDGDEVVTELEVTSSGKSQ